MSPQLLLLLLLQSYSTISMHVGPGSLTSTQSFEFVTKFVYNYNLIENTKIGTISGTVTAATPSYLVAYDDEPFSWNQMQQTNLSLCHAISHAPHGPAKHTWYLSPGKETPINLFVTEHLRPRVWYFAIVAEDWEIDASGLYRPVKCQTHGENVNAITKQLTELVQRSKEQLAKSVKQSEQQKHEEKTPKIQQKGGAQQQQQHEHRRNLLSSKPRSIPIDTAAGKTSKPVVNRLSPSHAFIKPAASSTTSATPPPLESNRIVDDKSIDLKHLNFVAGAEILSSHGRGKTLGQITIDLTFLNIEQGWQEQFGFDEYGILPFTVLLLLIYILLFSYQMYIENETMKHVIEASHASAIRRQHTSTYISSDNNNNNSNNNNINTSVTPLVRIWAILVVLQIFALTLRSLDLYSYATTGATATRWRWGRAMAVSIFSHSLDLLCRLGLTMAVFLVARGWTITSGPGEVRGKNQILGLFGITSLVEIGGHIFISLTYDPSTTSYGYSSTAGSVVIFWRFLILMWFVTNIFKTFQEETEYKRRRLYVMFMIVFSAWFLSMPAVVLTVNRLVAPHYRYMIVRITIDIIHFIALTAYGVMFWPSWSSQFFEIRSSPKSIEEQNQLLGYVETNISGSPGWSFNNGRASPQYKKHERGGSLFYNVGDDGL